MMDKKLKSNIVFNAITQLIVVLVPLITAPYVARKLNVELIGNYNYCYSIISIFALFANVGISTTGVSFVGKSKNNRKELSKTFYELMIVRLLFTFITIIIFLIFLFFTNEYKIYYLILSLNIVSTFLDITWFFQGLEDFKIVFIRTILVRIILLVAVFLFVSSESDIYAYIWINVLSLLIPNILLYPSLKNKIIKVPLYELEPFKKISIILKFFLPAVAYTLYSIVDKTMIKFITGGTVEVGYYEQAYKIAFVGVTLISVFSTVFSSRISGLSDDNEIKKLHVLSLDIIIFVSVLLFIGLFFLSDYFVPLYYGDGYEGSIRILKLFSVLPFVMGISNFVSYQYFIPKLITKPSIIIITGAIFINIALNCIFIRYYGGFGAALATLLSESFISISYLLFYNKYNRLYKLLKATWKYFICLVIDFIVFLFFTSFLQCNSFLKFVLYIISICATYIILLIILREEKTIYLLKYLFKKMSGGRNNG